MHLTGRAPRITTSAAISLAVLLVAGLAFADGIYRMAPFTQIRTQTAAWQHMSFNGTNAGFKCPASPTGSIVMVAGSSFLASSPNVSLKLRLVRADGSPIGSDHSFYYGASQLHLAWSWTEWLDASDAWVYLQWSSPNGGDFVVDANDEWSVTCIPAG